MAARGYRGTDVSADRPPATPAVVVVEGLDGAGKTTLARGLAGALERQGLACRWDRLARASVGIYRRLTEDADQPALMHQTLVPGPFRHMMYVTEAVAQFGYRAEAYAAFDVLVFDRWLETYPVYCSPEPAYPELAAQLAAQVPRPAATVYLTVPPEVAFARLVARGDPWHRALGDAELLRRLRAFGARYDALFAARPDAVAVDGLLSEDEVLAKALDAVTARLPC